MGRSELIWSLVKNNNAFIVKSQTQGGAVLSKDPHSDNNTHSFRHSGLAAHSAVGLSSRAKGGLNVTVKRPRVWKKGKNGVKNFNFSKFVASGSGAVKVVANFEINNLGFRSQIPFG